VNKNINTYVYKNELCGVTLLTACYRFVLEVVAVSL